MDTVSVLDYLVYLERDCACEDRHEFWTADGDPDIAAARDFAEAMRGRLGSYLDDQVMIEQRVNVVRLHLLDHSCPTAA